MAVNRPVRLYLASLGCPKNLVDSERALAGLTQGGMELVGDPEEADTILVNTCGFVADAKEESVDTILELAEIKKNRPGVKLAVMGCLSERYRDDLVRDIPEIDLIFGAGQLRDLVGALAPNPPTFSDPDELARVITTAPHWAYLKIAEGCSNNCAFCIIPAIRGPFISRPMESIVNEARRLADAGVKEINLVAQDSTLYGADLKIKDGLATLLKKLDKVDGIAWIRPMYLYPALVTDRLLRTMADAEKVVPYFDMPLQHADDAVLARMRRPETNAQIRRLIETIRRTIPDAAIRTAFITGFPGETDAAFETLLALVAESRFDHMGAFVYSPEEGTEAATMPDPVPEAVARGRYERLMTLQNGISAEKQEAKIGMTATVMVDGFDEDESLMTGRLATQAPGIDGSVILDGVEGAPGDFVEVTVTGATDYDLVATVGAGEE